MKLKNRVIELSPGNRLPRKLKKEIAKGLKCSCDVFYKAVFTVKTED